MSGTEEKIKVLIATGIYPPDPGGPASYVRLIEQRLPAFGYDVRVVTYADEPGRSNADKTIFRVSRRRNLLARYYDFAKAVWQQAGWADRIYVQGPVSEGLPAFLACKLRRKDYILKVVGDYAWEQGVARCGVKDLLDDFLAKKYGFKVELMRKIEKAVAKHAQTVVVPSQYLKRVVQRWGIDQEKIKVVYNTAGRIDGLPAKQALRAKLNLSGTCLLSVGRLVKWKGFAELIVLMPRIMAVVPDARLIIVGSGPLEAELGNLVLSHGLQDRVSLTGNLPKTEVLEYMAASDLFVLNTAYEGLSHVILEAMQNGLPVITTAVGGNGELIEDGLSGRLLPLGDIAALLGAIVALCYDNEAKMGYIEAAKKKSAAFSDDSMLSGLTAILRKK